MSVTATPTTVAQAISFAIDEVQEFGTADGLMGLPLDRDADEAIETALRITEVSAELDNREGDETSRGCPYSRFSIKTSDGKVFEIRVREVA